MFLGAEIRGAKHHVSPPNHHNFTTKNHPQTLWKSQNPLQKRPLRHARRKAKN